LAATVLLAGCGGADEKQAQVTPSSFVSQVCTSVGAWQQGIQSGSEQLDRKLKSAGSPADAKLALEQLVASWVASSERVVANLHAAGVPDVKGGATISAALVNTFQSAATDLRTLEGEVRSLPTGGSALHHAVTRLGSSLQGSLANIGVGLEGLHSSELRKAAEQSSSCKGLGAAGAR